MKRLILCFYLAAAVVIGALLAAIAAGVPFLEWLAFGKSIGLSVDNPMVIDLSVVKLAFGFEFGLTVAHILSFIAAFFAYRSTVHRLWPEERAARRRAARGQAEETPGQEKKQDGEPKDEFTGLS